MLYIFVDEAGNFDFSPKGTKYFIVTAVTMDSCDIAGRLLELRHDLAMSDIETSQNGFHCTEDKQAVRDRVFEIIRDHKLCVDAIALDKAKAYERIRRNEHYFYQLAWYFLLGNLAKGELQGHEDALIVGSTLGTGSRKRSFLAAFEGVVSQYSQNYSSERKWKPRSWNASSHPCIQVADYCCWAIQRKYERQDNRSWDLIKDKINSCREPFANSKVSG